MKPSADHSWDAGDPLVLLAALPRLAQEFLDAEAAGVTEDVVRAASELLKAEQGSLARLREQRAVACRTLFNAGMTLPEIAVLTSTTSQRVSAIIHGVRGGKREDEVTLIRKGRQQRPPADLNTPWPIKG